MMSNNIKETLDKNLIEVKTNKTHNTYLYHIQMTRLLNDFCNEYDIRFWGELDRDMLNNMVSYLKSLETLNIGTINKVIKYVKYIHKEFDIDNPDVRKIKTLKTIKKIPEIIPDNELKVIFDYIENNIDLDNGNYLAYVTLLNLLYDTGARISELLNVRKEDVNLKEKYITLRTTKTQKERQVPFTNNSVIIVYHLMKTNKQEWLFYNKLKKKQMNYSSVRYFFKVIKKNTGIDALRPHMFRHTLATKLVDLDIPVTTVQALLGHSDINTTMIYVHTHFKKHQKKYDNVNIRNY